MLLIRRRQWRETWIIGFINVSVTEKVAQRDVVHMLIKQKRSIRRHGTSARGTIRKNVLYYVFECPGVEKCTNSGRVVFEKGSGYSNPYKHIRGCLYEGDERSMFCDFQRARDANTVSGDSASDFDKRKCIVLPTRIKKELSMFAYIRQDPYPFLLMRIW